MKRPLVFYSISLSLGCLFALLFLDNTAAAIAIAAFFIIILFFTLEIKFFMVNVLFFLFGVFSFYLYFNINVQSPAQIRILEKKNYYFIGNFKGREIILKGKTDGLQEGQKIKAYGKFQKEFNIEKGVIGSYNLTEYKYCKKDFIYYSHEFKNNIYEKFRKIIGEDKAALVMALCYGETDYISEEKMSEFQKLGIIHAVSVSGFHMVIIYEVLEYMAGLKIAVIVSLFYVFFTGMAAATMRSFIMILIFKLAKVFFKEYDSISSLSLSALILMAFKPYYIVNLGFDLSFLATLGIILYNKKMYRKLYKLPEKLAGSISLTFSSQIFSLPYIAFTIQNFSYGFILGNLFLIPLFSVIIVLGNAALCSYHIEILFKYICAIINLVFTVIEGASIIALKLCPEVVYLSYRDGLMIMAVFISFVMYKKGYKKFKYIPAVCIILILLQGYSFFTSITFVNKNSGEAVIVKKGLSRIMICSYDYMDTNWISDVKVQQSVNKIITNPHSDFVYNLRDNSYLKINKDLKDCMTIILYRDNKSFKFSGDKNNNSYVIIFNRLFKINY
ncbi:ComEC/Rec2 family competence protein [Clostridium sp. JNZ X4-2]